MSIPKIYVAGPLNAMTCQYVENLHKMIIISEKIRRRGFSTYTPGTDLLVGLVMGNMKYDDYFGNSQPWLLASDAVFFMEGWRFSEGCKSEHALANKNRIPIYYDIDDMVHRFKKQLGVSKT